MSQISKAQKAILAIFVLAVVSVGTPMAFAAPWSSKKGEKPAENSAASLLQKLLDSEERELDTHIEYTCAALATQAQEKVAAVAKGAQNAAGKARAFGARMGLANTESVPTSEPDDDDNVSFGLPAGGITEGVAQMKELLELPFSSHRKGVPLNEVPLPPAPQLDPAAMAKAQQEGQRALMRAFDEKLAAILDVRKTDSEYVKKFIQSGSFIPKYASQERALFNRCRDALVMGRFTRCSELYRELFADTEIAYFRITFGGKLMQDIANQIILTRSRTDISEEAKKEILNELYADKKHVTIIREQGLSVFGTNYPEYMHVRSFFEDRAAELATYVGQHPDTEGHSAERVATAKEINAFLKTHDIARDPEFANFINRRAHLWPTPPTEPGMEVRASWHVEDQLSQPINGSHRKDFVILAIKGAKAAFPPASQFKFRILEKILAADKVYESADGRLAENGSDEFKEKKLTQFPTEHLAYIEKMVKSFEISDKSKDTLLAQIRILLTRPSMESMKQVFLNPKFNILFEKSIAEHRLRIEKSGNGTMTVLSWMEPALGLVEQIPTDSKAKATIANALKKLLGLSKKIDYIRHFAGEIDALRSVASNPQVQLSFLMKMNAKWNVSRGVKDEFLAAAAKTSEFRAQWVHLKQYVREISTSQNSSFDVQAEYTEYLRQMDEATKQAIIDGTISIDHRPTKLQIMHSIGGCVVTIAGALVVSYGTVKAVTIGYLLTKWAITAIWVLGQNGVHAVNQHLVIPLPDLPKL